MKPAYTSGDLATWSGGTWIQGSPDSISGFCIDTRDLSDDECFAALTGTRTDGHVFLKAAFNRGASSCLIENAEEAEKAGGPCLLVASTRNALQSIAAAYRLRLKARTIAVTGSVGKTTVKELIADMLGDSDVVSRSPGNWNNDLGLPLSMLRTKEDAAFAVFELGMNHPGELDPLCEILRPNAAVITNVGPVHIEAFNSVDDIADEKAAVCRILDESGYVVLPKDDALFSRLKKHCRLGKILTTSLKDQNADFFAERIAGQPSSFRIVEKASGEEKTIRAPLPGEYFVANALEAVAVARTEGALWDAVISAIEGYRPLPMRWQKEVISGVTVINDSYNANPVSMRAAINAFVEESATGRNWIVLGGMRELGHTDDEEHLSLGRFTATLNGELLFVGGKSGALVKGALDAGASAENVRVASNCNDAAEILKSETRAGDRVLIKASRGEHLENIVSEWVNLDGIRYTPDG